MNIDELLNSAREHAGQQCFAVASRLYQEALEHDSAPVRLEAARYFAARAFASGASSDAVRFCRMALAIDASATQGWLNLGVACRAVGDDAEALHAFAQALRLDDNNYTAALCVGELLEATDRDGAAMAYFRAILQAQARGSWRNRETTPASLSARIVHAMDFVDGGRERIFVRALEPLVDRFGASEMARVRKCLAIYLKKIAPDYSDPRQRPRFLYFPDLPTQAYLPRAWLPWIDELEANTDAIRREMLAVLAAGHGIEPFHEYGQLRSLVSSERGDGGWDAFFFYRHGKRFDENCANCPLTARSLEALPRAMIRDHAPEILFSVLRPKAHILPHRGVTNARVVAHLPLIVPPDCALNVIGDPPHVWREGEVMVFDDTFEHEAWNRSASVRVILLMDLWHPALSEAERLGLTQLVEAIGDFRVGGENILERLDARGPS